MTTLTVGRPIQEPLSSARSNRVLYWLPLSLILIAQAALTMRLFSYAASSDEGRYIYAGHQLIYELWHGGGSPYYETYFSGAPDFYSVLAAVADHLGGLTEVRLMSLTCMLTASIVLFVTTRRLFGYTAGCAASGLFSVLSLTHSLGAYANYDALALMIMSVAAYCAIRAGDYGEPSKWLLLVPTLIVVANVAKYSTLIFDPVVLALAAVRIADRKAALFRFCAVASALCLALGLAAYFAGSAYIKGVMFTTLSRQQGASVLLGASNSSIATIIHESVNWVGVVVVLAALALPISLLTDRRISRNTGLRLLAILLAAGLLVTIEALRLHSDESMNQHLDFGAWFASGAAGYMFSAIPQALSVRVLRYVALSVVAALVGITGLQYSSAPRLIAITTHSSDRHELRFVASVASYLRLDPQSYHYLIDGAFAEMPYDLNQVHVSLPWYGLADDNYFKYPVPGRGGNSRNQGTGRVCLTLRRGCVYLEGVAAYRAAIARHYFAFITLFGRSPYAQRSRQLKDWIIIQTVARTPGYVLVTRTGNAPTWIYKPDYKRSLR